jgi:hypothetical protein
MSQNGSVAGVLAGVLFREQLVYYQEEAAHVRDKGLEKVRSQPDLEGVVDVRISIKWCKDSPQIIAVAAP